MDAFASQWANLGVIGRYQHGEDYLSFGEFNLLVVVGDGLGEVLAKMKKLEGGIGEGYR
jgi:hypothetical protein